MRASWLLVGAQLVLLPGAGGAAHGQMVTRTGTDGAQAPQMAGAPSASETGRRGDPATSPAEVVWPAPPDPPRVRWVGELHSERQLGRKPSFFAKLKRSIAGVALGGVYTISRPYDVTALDSTRVYLTDGVTPAVMVFDRSQRRVEFLGADVPGGFAKPMGLGHDDRGWVYVADQAGRRVIVFDERGRFVRTFGGRDLLVNPVDVASDRAGNRWYVVDSYLHQVVVFDSSGSVVGRLGRDTGPVDTSSAPPGAHDAIPMPGSQHGDTTSWGPHGHGPGTPHGDSALAASHAAPAAQAPQTHSSGRARGRDVLDNRGAKPSEFSYPVSAAVGPDGTLWVVDQLNFRVQAFDRSGSYLRSVGSLGTTPGAFARPKGIGVDSEGHVYVVDAAFNNIQVFDDAGDLLLVIGAGGPNPGEMQLPMGLGLDRNDRIYVADRYNGRIAMYQFLGAPATQPAGSGAGAGPP